MFLVALHFLIVPPAVLSQVSLQVVHDKSRVFADVTYECMCALGKALLAFFRLV